MKVGFCGSHSTGKTSVALELAERTGMQLVTSASREVHSIGYPINQGATVLSQAATSMARLAKQLSAGNKFVSDRTLLDSMAYNEYQLENVWDTGEKSMFWYDTMDTITRYTMPLYDLIVYFPVTFSPTHDGVRSTDIEYQRDIDFRIQRFIASYGLTVYTIGGGTVEERTTELEGLIK